MTSHRAHAAHNRFLGRVRAKLDVAFSVLRELEHQLRDNERRRPRSRAGRWRAVAVDQLQEHLYDADVPGPIEVTVIDAEPLIVRSESEARWAREREHLMAYVETVCAEATQLAAGQRIRVPATEVADAAGFLARQRARTVVALPCSLEDADVGDEDALRPRWVSRASGVLRRGLHTLARRTRAARTASALILLSTAIRLAVWLMGRQESSSPSLPSPHEPSR